MKLLNILLAFFILASCAVDEDSEKQPMAPWTYPVTEYRVITTLASRVGETKITRLVGWDREFYYFDWSEAGEVITRGTGRADRKQFDLENQGALTLAESPITVRDGKVRTLALQ